ncbi:MAG: glycosyltransferase family 2 protein [Nitrospirae bacterium]|nr:glycosyltransferase family 2 protein [Nitrospirota bacterium]
MAKLSVYILTYNEETKIEAALKSVSWADEIVIVDSGSTDRTIDIAKQYNARIVNVPFEGFGKLRNSAIAACSHEMILSLDADERCTPEVRDEILAIIEEPKADAYHIPRRNYFMGRWIRYSGWYPDYRQPQLFRRSAMVYRDEDVVHEGFVVNGKIGYLKNAIWQFPFRNLSQVISKIERYSNLGVKKLGARGVKGGMTKALVHAIGNFLRMYVLKLGVLDGWPGFVIAMSSFEGSFYKYAKLAEKEFKWDQPPKGME